jgi:membrane protein DedA with SNARE-associated domain
LEHIVYLLTEYKYLILFPLAIVEGPIIAIIAGFLCTNGFLNPLFVFPIIISGDVIGDSFPYFLGRWGNFKFLRKIRTRFGLNSEKLHRVRIFFDSNPAKTIFLSKVILGVGVAGLFLAGNAKVPYYKFFRICLVTSAIQYSIYLTIGFLFGHAYIQINHYFNRFAAISIIIALALIFFITIKSLFKKL